MTIPGGLDDQTIHLSWGLISNSPFTVSDPNLNSFHVYRTIFEHLLNPLLANQPLSTLILSIGLSVFGPNFYFIISLVSVGLTFLFARLLLKKYRYSFLWALIFTFSSYMWSHLWKHIDLLQIWIFPLFFIIFRQFFTINSLKNAVKLAVFFTVSTLISNYAGFMSLIYFLIACTVNLFYKWYSEKKFDFLLLRNTVLTVLIFACLLVITLFPYIKANYLGYKQVGRTVARTYEDFFSFSSRPWYFLLPPVKNPMLGGFSVNILERIKRTDYFLADDYFANEHQGNFFGIVFLLVSSLVLLWSYKNSVETRKNITIYIVCNLILFILMFPPFFTIGGMQIYTPGYLLYKYFPMFRVSSRFSVILLLNLVTITAYVVNENYEKLKSNLKYLNLIIICLTIVPLIETFVPFDLVKKDNPPAVYLYLYDNTPENSIFAVYPNNSTLDAMYWIYIHKRLLMNPKYYTSESMVSEEFTMNLNTEEGLTKLIELNGEYLIVFKNVLEEDKEFFENNSKIKLVNEFYDSYLFKIDKI